LKTAKKSYPNKWNISNIGTNLTQAKSKTILYPPALY